VGNVPCCRALAVHDCCCARQETLRRQQKEQRRNEETHSTHTAHTARGTMAVGGAGNGRNRPCGPRLRSSKELQMNRLSHVQHPCHLHHQKPPVLSRKSAMANPLFGLLCPTAPGGSTGRRFHPLVFMLRGPRGMCELLLFSQSLLLLLLLLLLSLQRPPSRLPSPLSLLPSLPKTPHACAEATIATTLLSPSPSVCVLRVTRRTARGWPKHSCLVCPLRTALWSLSCAVSSVRRPPLQLLYDQLPKTNSTRRQPCGGAAIPSLSSTLRSWEPQV
jgi:hypothetical protein